MTRKQKWLYWHEWNLVRKTLVEERGWKSSAADEFRHALHVRALGADKSHKDFTNADFDKILAVFRARSRPADFDAQMRQVEQPEKRLYHSRGVLGSLIRELGLSPNYVEAMALKICKRKVIDLQDRDIPKLIAALNYHKARRSKREAVEA